MKEIDGYPIGNLDNTQRGRPRGYKGDHERPGCLTNLAVSLALAFILIYLTFGWIISAITDWYWSR